MRNTEGIKNAEYFSWIGDLKRRYRATQIKAAVSVNSTLLEFYWNLGRDICEKYPGKRRNAHFFAELSADLKIAIPDGTGFSPNNLRYIRGFFELYSCRRQPVNGNGPGGRSLQQAVGDKIPAHYLQQVVGDNRQHELDFILRVPWGHHVLIMNKCGGDVAKALFYVRKTVENGWSRNVLAIEIDGDLYSRQGKAVTNFALTMPGPDSDLAQQLTKDPYVFEVQGLAGRYRETELTRAMCDNIVRLLNAMGRGFAFVGREYVLPTVEEIEAELANMEKEESMRHGTLSGTAGRKGTKR